MDGQQLSISLVIYHFNSVLLDLPSDTVSGPILS